jgi:hypothetical protein
MDLEVLARISGFRSRLFFWYGHEAVAAYPM